MSFEFSGGFSLPGIQAALETIERTFYWGPLSQQTFQAMVIEGAARDTGNTNQTDVLRPGLPLGKLTTGDKLTDWDPTATDGSEKLYGFLVMSQKMQRLGSNADRFVGWVQVAGNIKAQHVIIPGQTSYGIGGVANEHLMRAQGYGRFLFDDDLQGNAHGGWKTVTAKTAAYTVLEADNNTLFTNKGDADAIVFTLPTAAERGLRYGFYVAADQSLTVTAGTVDTMIVFNDAAADSVAFSTSGDKVGGMIEVIGDGALWMTMLYGWGSDGVLVQTATIGT
jgi:hypothetical protein